MATRRGVGVGAIQKNRAMQARLREKGSEMSSEELERLRIQLEAFTVRLEDFASNHRSEIRKNPQFRRHFQEMCASVGVDPLASSKGFWAEKLGVGDFYYELGVQIIEVCMASNHSNGGIMSLEEIKQRLDRSRNKTRRDTISQDDLLRAIEKLRVLGSGFTLIPLGSENRYLVQSVPGELSMDHTRVLQLAEDTAFVTVTRLMEELGWSRERSLTVVFKLVESELAWRDEGGTGEASFWFPSLFMHHAARSKTSSSSRTSSDESAK